jgi:hypothetical protein
VSIDHPDRASRYIMMRELAKLSTACGADGVITISEAWTAQGPDIPSSGFAVDAKNRGEALTLSAANAHGETYYCHAFIQRSSINQKKIKSLSETHSASGEINFILTPFQKEWGCLDMTKLEEAFKSMQEFGIGAVGPQPTDDVLGSAP